MWYTAHAWKSLIHDLLQIPVWLFAARDPEKRQAS